MSLMLLLQLYIHTRTRTSVPYPTTVGPGPRVVRVVSPETRFNSASSLIFRHCSVGALYDSTLIFSSSSSFFIGRFPPQWHRKEGRKELDFQGWGGRAECVVSFHLQQLKGEPRPQEERKSFLFSPQHLCVKKSREKSEAMRNLR